MTEYKILNNQPSKIFNFNGPIEIYYLGTKQIKSKIYYINNKLNGSYETWFENGKSEIQCNYKNGLLHGNYKVWHNINNDTNTESNILKIRCNYKNGKLNGLYQEWHDNGKLWNKCTYLNGEYDGDFESWQRDGFLRDSRFYINGKLQTDTNCISKFLDCMF
jgi:antitoxin component YwqK of YwqJK toxin-antitoxin module